MCEEKLSAAGALLCGAAASRLRRLNFQLDAGYSLALNERLLFMNYCGCPDVMAGAWDVFHLLLPWGWQSIITTW